MYAAISLTCLFRVYCAFVCGHRAVEVGYKVDPRRLRSSTRGGRLDEPRHSCITHHLGRAVRHLTRPKLRPEIEEDVRAIIFRESVSVKTDAIGRRQVCPNVIIDQVNRVIPWCNRLVSVTEP